jgi:replicative DNA helicase
VALYPRPASDKVREHSKTMATFDSNVLKLAPDAGTPAYRSAPHNIEAEQSLLGAILVNNDAFYRVSDFLEPKHFFEPIHQTIYETAGSLIRMGKVATPVTLKTFVPADTDIGGMTVGQYLARLAAEATTIINAQDYGRTVYELALRRDLIRIGEDMVNVAFDAPVDFAPRAQIEDAERRLYELAATTAGSSGLRRPSPLPSIWRRKRFSATANCPASPPACAISTSRWAACSRPI